MLSWRPRPSTTHIWLDNWTGNPVSSTYDQLLVQSRQRGLLAVGWHFVIETSGAVISGRPLEAVGSHASGYNADSVGILLGLPHSDAQLQALANLQHRIHILYGRLPLLGPAATDDLRSTLREYTAMHLPDTPPASSLSTQQQLVLHYLKSGRTLTTQIAMVSLGIASLSSRIAELRAMGHDITDTWSNDYHGRTYKQYSLDGAAKAAPDAPLADA